MIKVATPPESVGEPSTVEPSMKLTVPVAVPPPGAAGLTMAVKVTDWPKTDGVRRRNDRGGRSIPVDGQADWDRAAVGEVDIPAVTGGDRVRADCQRRRGQGGCRRAARERRAAQHCSAVKEGDHAVAGSRNRRTAGGGDCCSECLGLTESGRGAEALTEIAEGVATTTASVPRLASLN